MFVSFISVPSPSRYIFDILWKCVFNLAYITLFFTRLGQIYSSKNKDNESKRKKPDKQSHRVTSEFLFLRPERNEEKRVTKHTKNLKFPME